MGNQSFEKPESIELLKQIIVLASGNPITSAEISKITGRSVYSLNPYLAYLRRLNLLQINHRVKNQPFYCATGKEYVPDMADELDAPRRFAPKIQPWQDRWLFCLHAPFTEAM